ncbi:hypothetical protein T492DRAFT_849601 [Pavlovales sp. CCMP2436]|nr:hypothetical protein T492DRAFT_849601 [Pavlovales sp. CCMP2436]
MLTGRAALALMLLALGAPLAAMGRRLASHPLATRLAPVARASGSTMRMSDIAAPSWPRDAQMVPQGLPGGGVSLTGTLTKVLYARPGYYVYILHTAQGRTPDVTLVSRTDIASSGHIRVEGRWGFHYKYGERFDVWSAFVEANGAAGQPLEPTAMAAVYPAHPAHSTQYTQPQFAQPPYPAQPAHSTQYTPPQFAQPTYAQPHTLPKYTYSQHAPQHQYARPHTKQQYTYPQQAQPQFAQPQFTQPQYSAYPVVHPASEHVVVHPASEHVGWAPAASPLPAWQQPTAPPARAAYSYAPPGNAAAALYARPSYPRPAAALETIVGTLSSITFRSDDGFTIARLILEKAKSFGESSGPAGLELNRKREKGVRSKSVVVRSAEALAFTRVGDTLTLTGAWSTHAKFGRQFDATAMPEPALTTSKEE